MLHGTSKKKIGLKYANNKELSVWRCIIRIQSEFMGMFDSVTEGLFVYAAW